MKKSELLKLLLRQELEIIALQERVIRLESAHTIVPVVSITSAWENLTSTKIAPAQGLGSKTFSYGAGSDSKIDYIDEMT